MSTLYGEAYALYLVLLLLLSCKADHAEPSISISRCCQNLVTEHSQLLLPNRGAPKPAISQYLQKESQYSPLLFITLLFIYNGYYNYCHMVYILLFHIMLPLFLMIQAMFYSQLFINISVVRILYTLWSWNQ